MTQEQKVSIHAPREGCDTSIALTSSRINGFNSRTPGGVRLKAGVLAGKEAVVSIHAPREGCDLADFRRRIAARKFQFTHPGRGATKMAKLLFENSDVSIHAPREGCDLFLILIIRVSVCFNSRTPGGVRRHSSLSYHHKACFNSRTPGGVRLIVIRVRRIDLRFQFTHPGRGATSADNQGGD